MKTICYYHNDPDGIMSGAIVAKYCDNNYRQLELRPINYDYDFEKEYQYVRNNSFDSIIIVDFCFPEEYMNKFCRVIKHELIWIDHHQIIDTYKVPSYIRPWEGLRSQERSGCALTWNHFFPTEPMPLSVEYVEDLDLWKWEWREKSEPFINIFAMKIHKPDDVNLYFDLVRSRDKKAEDDFIAKGNLLIEAQKTRVIKSFEAGKDIMFEGHKTRLINSNHDDSQIGEYCYKDKGYPIGMIWKVGGSKITVSLRSWEHANEIIDVGSLAKKNGGGGHLHASGFVMELNDFWERFLK